MKDKTIGELLSSLADLQPNTILHAKLSGVQFWGMVLVVSFIWLMGSAVANVASVFLFAGFLVALSLGAIVLLSLLPGTELQHRHEHYHTHRIERAIAEPEPKPETKRIECNPSYTVLVPEQRLIEQQPNRVYLPTAKEYTALPVNRKMLEAKR